MPAHSPTLPWMPSVNCFPGPCWEAWVGEAWQYPQVIPEGSLSFQAHYPSLMAFRFPQSTQVSHARGWHHGTSSFLNDTSQEGNSQVQCQGSQGEYQGDWASGRSCQLSYSNYWEQKEAVRLADLRECWLPAMSSQEVRQRRESRLPGTLMGMKQESVKTGHSGSLLLWPWECLTQISTY